MNSQVRSNRNLASNCADCLFAVSPDCFLICVLSHCVSVAVTSQPRNESELQLYRVLQRANLLSYYDTFIAQGGDDVHQVSQTQRRLELSHIHSFRDPAAGIIVTQALN